MDMGGPGVKRWGRREAEKQVRAVSGHWTPSPHRQATAPCKVICVPTAKYPSRWVVDWLWLI